MPHRVINKLLPEKILHRCFKVICVHLLELVQLSINKLFIAVEFGALGEELFHFGFVHVASLGPTRPHPVVVKLSWQFF